LPNDKLLKFLSECYVVLLSNIF